MLSSHPMQMCIRDRTYTVAPDGTVTFVPEKSFTGEGTGVTVKRVDKNGTPVTATYTPTVTPVTPTATSAAVSYTHLVSHTWS